MLMTLEFVFLGLLGLAVLAILGTAALVLYHLFQGQA